MLGNKTERKKEDLEKICEYFLKGNCKLGKKCEKKLPRRNQFEMILMNINKEDEELLKSNDGEDKKHYYMRSRVKKIPNEDNKIAKEDILKDKMKKRKSKKDKIKKDKLTRGKKDNKSIIHKKAKTTKIPKAPKIPKALKKQKAPKNDKKKFSVMTSRTKIIDEDCEDFLIGECKKVFCDKIHNFTLKFKEQNNLEFARRYLTIHQDFTVLEPFQRKLYENSVLDLMFIVDCTGSMSSWIATVKDELKNIISFIKDNNPYSRVRISFVGYRDFDMSLENRFSILNFTEDAEQAKKFISGVDATGGADTPEDLAGGLQKGLDQTWFENSAKYCILICDAPCHGEQYHNFDDTYPKGCPNGLIPEDLIKVYARKQVTFYSVKIKSYTDQMFGIFSSKYQEITKQPIVVADLGKSTEKFAFLVSVAANNTLSSVTINNISLREFLNSLVDANSCTMTEMNDEYRNKLNNFVSRVNTLVVEQEELIPNDVIQEEENIIKAESESNLSVYNNYPVELNLKIIDNKFPNFDSLSNQITLEAVCHAFIIKKDRYTNINFKNPFIQHSKMKSKITISQDPFSEGCNRFAFYMKENSLKQHLVAKLPKVLRKNEYSIEGLSKELESITICNHTVNEFNNRIVNIVPDTRLLFNFINCFIYEILDPNNTHPYKYYTVENYIRGEYVKYNNNAGWISQNVTDQVLLAQTFSHFSWQITKGYLCVVDLQGVGGYLTDPQIHCLNSKKFGSGNFGYVGMMKFFMSHNCNSYCKKLELIHPKNLVNIDKDYKFFVDKYTSPENPDSKIYKLCDLCKNPYQAKAGDLFNLKKKCWDGFCDECDSKRKSEFQGAKCTICDRFFKSSAYVYKMKRQSFPDKCQKCTQEDRNKLRDDYYKDNNEEEEREI